MKKSPRHTILSNVSVSNALKVFPGVFAYLKLLNLPLVELKTAIEQKLEENPFIELEEAENQVEQENEDEGKETEEQNEVLDNEEQGDIDYELIEDFLYRDEDEWEPRVLSNRKESEVWEKITPKEPSYYEKLRNHIYPSLDSVEEFIVADYIIDNVNEKGFLELEEKDIVKFIKETEAYGVKLTREFFEKVRFKIMNLKPYGIAAMDIKESLEFQIKKLDISEEKKKILIELVKDYAKELSEGKHEEVEKNLNLSSEEIVYYVSIIKSLELFPGEFFSKQLPEHIVPDVFIEKEDGEYAIYLNDFHMPKVRVSSYYKKILKELARIKENKDNREYMKKMLEDAVRFIKAIDYRNKSIYKTAEAILYFQKEFFDKGTEYLKPLRLKEVAEYTGLNEATISRVISGKYIATPRGLFPFKYFFPKSGVKTKEGENILTDKVKRMIKKIIEDENKDKPYSDQEIVIILNTKGVRIKRRTVAKYREMMGIPSSKERKRFYKISGGEK